MGMRTVCAIWVLILLFVSTNLAAEVVLKDGRSRYGRVTRIDNKEVEITRELGHGAMTSTCERERIESIEGLTYEDFKRVFERRNAFLDDETVKVFNQVVKESKERIAEKRNTEITLDFESEVVNKDSLRKLLTEKLKTEQSASELEGERKLMAFLGLIDPDEDFGDNLVEAYTESIEGVYFPEDKKFYYIVDDEDDKLELYNPLAPNLVVIHELVHVMQDQMDFLADDKEKVLVNDDVSLASKSIIEGGATYISYSILSDHYQNVEKHYGYKNQKSSRKNGVKVDYESLILESAALVFKNLKNSAGAELAYEIMTFPYLSGGKFMKYGFDHGSWEKFDNIYSDPPRSTEQIIHPEKYFLAREDPIPMTEVNFDSLLAGEGKIVTEGGFGEFGFYTFVGKFKDRLYADMASAGWGNDRYCLYENDRGLLFVSESVWDTTKDLDEFKQTLREIVSQKYRSFSWGKDGDLLKGSNGRNLVWVARNGARLMWLESNFKDEALLARVLDQTGFRTQ